MDRRTVRMLALVAMSFASGATLPARAEEVVAQPRPQPAQDVQPALLPGVWVNHPAFANGCWVRFYDKAGFGGEQFLLVGPLDVPELADSREPLRDWDSAVVGPRALVTTYEREDFRGSATTLRAGQRVESLTDATHRVGDIRSVRVNCSLG